MNTPKKSPGGANTVKSKVGPDEPSRTGAEQAIQAVDKPTLPERYKHFHSGKVRETYVNPDNPNELIIIATDRISTHDVVHKSLIPGKGTCLTQISNHWFDVLSQDDRTKNIPSQMVSPQIFPDDFPEEYKSRAIVVKKLKALPIEAIVRGYLYGSAFEDKNTGKKYDKVTGRLPTGEFVGKNLQKCSKFDKPLFTPSTKVQGGHDKNISYNQLITDLFNYYRENGEEASLAFNKANSTAEKIKEYSLSVYEVINEHSKKKGVTLGDTKLEFGEDENGDLYIIDEICTPDSSRYWTTKTIIPGKEPKSHDKQPVRDYVVKESERRGKKAGDVAIRLPVKVINETMKTYSGMTNMLCAA